MKVKVENGWADKSFNNHLSITKDLLPSPNSYPGTYREVKRLLKNMGMGYEIIHACEYSCALFYKDNKHLLNCLVCDESRYLDDDRDRMIPRKVVINAVSHRGVYSDSSLARKDEIEIANAKEDDPYQKEMPTNITSDVQPTTQFNSNDDNIDNQTPKARMQLYLDEEDDTSKAGDDDDSLCDGDDEMFMEQEDNQVEEGDESDDSMA
ncbi:hypothetical protein QQ045_032754 [Rhodiola kirilowii]